MADSTWNTSNKLFNFDPVYDALISLAQSIEDPPEEDDETPKSSLKLVEAGQPENIPLYQGDLAIVGLGKINRIEVSMGGKSKIAHVNGAYLIMTEGTDEDSQRRASLLWDKLFTAVERNRTLGIKNCKCKVDYENPGGMRQFDTNFGISKTPNYCAGAVLRLKIRKTQELIQNEGDP